MICVCVMQLQSSGKPRREETLRIASRTRPRAIFCPCRSLSARGGSATWRPSRRKLGALLSRGTPGILSVRAASETTSPRNTVAMDNKRNFPFDLFSSYRGAKLRPTRKIDAPMTRRDDEFREIALHRCEIGMQNGKTGPRIAFVAKRRGWGREGRERREKKKTGMYFESVCRAPASSPSLSFCELSELGACTEKFCRQRARAQIFTGS